MKALINADIYDYYSFRPNSYLLFDTAVREVGEMKAFKGAEEVYDCKNALVLPGFINGHAHIYSAFVRGLQLKPYQPETFRQLLEQLWWRFDAGLDLESSYYSARVYGIENIKAGVTTIFDHHASGAAIRGTLAELKRGLCDDTGMRGLFCFETSDRFNVDDCIQENLDFIRNGRSDHAAGMFGMHASLSLSDGTLGRIAEVIGDYSVYVHVGESLQEENESLARYGKRSLQRYRDHRLLNRNSLLAHCTNIDESEAEIAAEQGCVAAINANSNMNAANGLPDYGLLKQHHVKTIIGNDSFGVDMSRDYLSTLYCMHFKMNSAWKFGYDDLLTCIRNVYDYAGTMLGISIGRLEPGYVADMMEVPYRVATVCNQGNIFDYLVSGVFQNVFHPRAVWCGGDLKMKNYETVWDEEEVYARAREAATKFWKKIGGI